MVEHSIGNGEVDSSILSGSTSFPLQNNGLADQPLPVPPHLNRERKSNPPQIVGEIKGNLLAECSAALALYNDINACQNPDQLDAMVRLISERYLARAVNDKEYSDLLDCIERRRSLSRRTSTGKFATIRLNGRVSRFLPRPCRRHLSEEERVARRHRKRKLGGSSALPDTLRHHFTEGERAALCVAAGEVKRHGILDLSIGEIADIAGVGRTTVQNAFHEARRLGLIKITERPVPGLKNLPNVVEIISPEWLTWIKRGPSAARPLGSNSFKNVSTLKIKEERKKEEGGFAGKEVDRWWLHEPIRTANGGWS